MTLDARGRRAGADLRREVDHLGSSQPDRGSSRASSGSALGSIGTGGSGPGSWPPPSPSRRSCSWGRCSRPSVEESRRPPPSPAGASHDASSKGLAAWFTVRPDGTAVRDLGIETTCAVWYPDGSGILITNDDAAGPAAPLRPAVVDPDGSNLSPLDATENPDLNLGCGDVSPDGTRIALEGFGQDGHPNLDGIYSVRASDGGGLVRLLRGTVAPPWYSPDGTDSASSERSRA